LFLYLDFDDLSKIDLIFDLAFDFDFNELENKLYFCFFLFKFDFILFVKGD